eukprot:scaffold38755_cov19-Tisochrysis_lutea.AAC.1
MHHPAIAALLASRVTIAQRASHASCQPLPLPNPLGLNQAGHAPWKIRILFNEVPLHHGAQAGAGGRVVAPGRQEVQGWAVATVMQQQRLLQMISVLTNGRAVATVMQQLAKNPFLPALQQRLL